MKVFLLYSDRDADLQAPLPWNEKELTQDLVLDPLFETMAAGDDFLLEVSRKTIFSSLENDVATVNYRQDVFRDCLKNASLTRLLYDLVVGAYESRRKGWFGVFINHSSSILSSSISTMEIFSDMLKQLRKFADENKDQFSSAGFIRLFTMLQNELTDEYFREIENHLKELRFPDGMLISYELGKGNKGINPKLRGLLIEPQNWFQRLFGKRPSIYSFQIHPRDEGGIRALSEIRDQAVNNVANALAQSCDHILQFFLRMKTELAFYVACLNLQEHMVSLGAPVCYPVALDSGFRNLACTGLYDISLSIRMQQPVVGNEIDTQGRNPVIITGANQGGKSTFLRSVGTAQLMMQSGMTVAAQSFSSKMYRSMFTHFKREEDVTMKSGKFDEELSRMSAITDHITGHSLFLFNESFAATNEREGSEIAFQISHALTEKGFQVFFVTHLFDLASRFYNRPDQRAMFLRADRDTDAHRSFKLTEGNPLATSFGEDIYEKVFNPPDLNNTNHDSKRAG